MFTGIIQYLGTICQCEFASQHKSWILKIHCLDLEKSMHLGDSLSVDGVCLTIDQIEQAELGFHVMEPTGIKSTIAQYQVGQVVNLEKALTLADPLGGHLINGHVDTKIVLKRKEKTAHSLMMEWECPEQFYSKIVDQGSVAINGVSLTVSALKENNCFQVNLVDYTQEHTNLAGIAVGGQANFEQDWLARYVWQYLQKYQKN